MWRPLVAASAASPAHCASPLSAQGVEALIIVKTFGHITIAVALDAYARVVNATLQAPPGGWTTRLGRTKSPRRGRVRLVGEPAGRVDVTC
jgi:hypothetical protein